MLQCRMSPYHKCSKIPSHPMRKNKIKHSKTKIRLRLWIWPLKALPKTMMRIRKYLKTNRGMCKFRKRYNLMCRAKLTISNQTKPRWKNLIKMQERQWLRPKDKLSNNSSLHAANEIATCSSTITKPTAGCKISSRNRINSRPQLQIKFKNNQPRQST